MKDLLVQRTFYDLTYHSRVDNEQVVARDQVTPLQHLAPWKCQPLDQEMFTSTRLWVRGDTIADYLPNNLSWPICSERFLRVFREVVPAEHFQEFHLQVCHEATDEPEGPYTLINILKLVDAVDEQLCAQSFIGEKGDPLRMTPTPIIQLRRMPADVHLCRLRFGGTSVVVSGEFLEAARNAKVTGMAFIPIEAVP